MGREEFYLDCLTYKGYYVTAPSTSPENTFLAPDMTTHSVTFASTMDISILRELFGLYLKACEILGVEDFTNAVKNVLQKLPPIKLGKKGSFRNGFMITRKQISITDIFLTCLDYILGTRFIKRMNLL